MTRSTHFHFESSTFCLYESKVTICSYVGEHYCAMLFEQWQSRGAYQVTELWLKTVKRQDKHQSTPNVAQWLGWHTFSLQTVHFAYMRERLLFVAMLVNVIVQCSLSNDKIAECTKSLSDDQKQWKDKINNNALLMLLSDEVNTLSLYKQYVLLIWEWGYCL